MGEKCIDIVSDTIASVKYWRRRLAYRRQRHTKLRKMLIQYFSSNRDILEDVPLLGVFEESLKQRGSLRRLLNYLGHDNRLHNFNERIFLRSFLM